MLKIGSNYALYADKYNFKLVYMVDKEDATQVEKTVGYYSSYEGVVKGIVSDMQRRNIEDVDATMDCIDVLREETEEITAIINSAIDAMREIKPSMMYVPTKGRTSTKTDT